MTTPEPSVVQFFIGWCSGCHGNVAGRWSLRWWGLITPWIQECSRLSGTYPDAATSLCINWNTVLSPRILNVFFRVNRCDVWCAIAEICVRISTNWLHSLYVCFCLCTAALQGNPNNASKMESQWWLGISVADHLADMSRFQHQPNGRYCTSRW